MGLSDGAVSILYLPLGELHNVWEPQCTHLQNGDSDTALQVCREVLKMCALYRACHPDRVLQLCVTFPHTVLFSDGCRLSFTKARLGNGLDVQKTRKNEILPAVLKF